MKELLPLFDISRQPPEREMVSPATRDPQVKRMIAVALALFAASLAITGVILITRTNETITAQGIASDAQSTASVAISQAQDGQGLASVISEACATRTDATLATSLLIRTGSPICETAQSIAAQTIAVPVSESSAPAEPTSVVVTVTRLEPGIQSTVTNTVVLTEQGIAPAPVTTTATATIVLPPGPPGEVLVTLPAQSVTVPFTITATETATVTETAVTTETAAPVTETQPALTETVTITETPAPITETATVTETTTETVIAPPP